MECPNCKHAASNSTLLQCSHCGEAFERGPLEEFQHLEYLLLWLEKRTEISFSQQKELKKSVQKKQDALRSQLLPVLKKETPAPVADVTPAPPPKPEPAPAPMDIPQPQTKPTHVVQQPIKAAIVPPLKPAAPPKLMPAPKPVAAKPAPAPKPVAPPKPQRPPVDWKKVRDQFADAVTSGALLRALLYLGAFMIVISATVLVVRFWNQFNQVLQFNLYRIHSVDVLHGRLGFANPPQTCSGWNRANRYRCASRCCGFRSDIPTWRSCTTGQRSWLLAWGLCLLHSVIYFHRITHKGRVL